MQTFEVLEKALALIEREENWCGNGWGRDGSYCALHALDKAGFKELPNPCYYRTLGPFLGGERLVPFNDSASHAEVVTLFQRAIAQEKRKVGVFLEVPEEAKTLV